MKGHHAPAFSFALLFGGLALLPLLSGCTAHSKDGSGGTGTSTAASGNTLRYALSEDPTNLDPAKVEDGTTIDMIQQVFEGLVKWNEKNEIVPNLCEKWTLSDDGKTYTFLIRKGIKFHNGRELTAEDFKYSIERACDPKTASTTAGTYLKDIVGANDKLTRKATDVAGVKVVDPYTLQITIDAFKPYWMGNLTYPASFAVCKEVVEQNGGVVDEKASVGTGPFKLAEYQRGYQLTLKANPDYHEGRPKLDAIIRPIIKEATTRLSKYEAGELDILLDVSPRDLDHINGDPKLKADLHTFKRAATWYVGLNGAAKDSPFKEKEVRLAFAMAIDRNEAVRVAMKGEADVADRIVPPGMPGYDMPIKPIPYDPAQAKALLAKAGFPDGKGFPTLPFTFRQDYPHVAETAQLIASQLKTNLNINIEVRPMEWGQFLRERTNRTMPLTHLRWGADYLDPQNYLSVLLHTNHVVNGQDDHPENGLGYSNPAFDALCDKADVEHDAKKRMAMYLQAEQMAVDDAPWVPIYFQRDIELIKPRVGNIRDSLLGHLPHLTTTVTP